MAYLSDIDLATLHKKRLEEKNNYKLSSCYNRRFYDEETCRERSSIMAEKQRVKTKVSDKATTKSKAKTSPINKEASIESVDDREKFTLSDEGYFSSSTLNRRRSGTWP
jgi:predicted nuclease of restriction endonuclease-like (RecB) superfamily